MLFWHALAARQWPADGNRNSLIVSAKCLAAETGQDPVQQQAAALLVNQVMAQVFVQTADGWHTAHLKQHHFSVVAGGPAAVISAISPRSATARSPDFNFVPRSGFVESFVVWSANATDTPLHTTFVSTTELTAIVPAALLQQLGTAQVLVETGDIMDDSFQKSNSTPFTINP